MESGSIRFVSEAEGLRQSAVGALDRRAIHDDRALTTCELDQQSDDQERDQPQNHGLWGLQLLRIPSDLIEQRAQCENEITRVRPAAGERSHRRILLQHVPGKYANVGRSLQPGQLNQSVQPEFRSR